MAFYFDPSYQDPKLPLNLGNFADQLSAIGSAPTPSSSSYNLGNIAEKLSPKGAGAAAQWLPYILSGLGAGAKAGLAALLAQPESRGSYRQTVIRREPTKRWAFSDYLASLSSDPGHARL